jgi:hypothetical protein
MSGDALARGARSATFGPPKGVTQSKWDVAFEDFDPEVFRNKPEPSPDPNAMKSLVHTGLK